MIPECVVRMMNATVDWVGCAHTRENLTGSNRQFMCDETAAPIATVDIRTSILAQLSLGALPK